jgi:hypothetical protein
MPHAVMARGHAGGHIMNRSLIMSVITVTYDYGRIDNDCTCCHALSATIERWSGRLGENGHAAYVRSLLNRTLSSRADRVALA